MTNQYTLTMWRRGMLKWVALAGITILGSLGIGSETLHASDKDLPAFCDNHVLRDYLAPLDHIPVSSRFDLSGQLSVGPDSLRIFVPKGRLVPIGIGMFGARGSVMSPKKSVRLLKWTVISKLEKVRDTNEGQIVRRKRQYIGKVAGFNGRQFGFASNDVKPGSYRLTVEIRNPAGKRLETHQETFRAIRPRSNLKLVSSFSVIAPGDRGYIRIDNLGTVEASYGANYRLWNSNGEELAVSSIFGNVLYRLPAGMAGPCITFSASDGLTPGEYRLGSTASDALHRNQLLTTAFLVN